MLFRLGESSLRAGRREEGRSLFEEALATPEGKQREEAIRRLMPDLPAVPPALPVAPPLNPGERLRYSARYLFFRFATLEMENQGFTEFRGSRVARIVFTVRSNPGFPFLCIDSRFESLMAEDGSVLAHRSVSRDSTQADLRTVGSERIRWAGHEVETVQVEAVGRYKGPAGLSGLVRTWISPDARALPYRAAVKLGLGSIVLELCPDAGGPED